MANNFYFNNERQEVLFQLPGGTSAVFSYRTIRDIAAKIDPDGVEPTVDVLMLCPGTGLRIGIQGKLTPGHHFETDRYKVGTTDMGRIHIELNKDYLQSLFPTDPGPIHPSEARQSEDDETFKRGRASVAEDIICSIDNRIDALTLELSFTETSAITASRDIRMQELRDLRDHIIDQHGEPGK